LKKELSNLEISMNFRFSEGMNSSHAFSPQFNASHHSPPMKTAEAQWR
jgi:hypothetical protein